MTQSNAAKKKSLASFYTPEKLAQILTDWAICSPHTTVLDPSFGGCAFLNAALISLKNKGATNPGKQIYGVDIDSDTRNYITAFLEADATPEQFITSDFFSVVPAELNPNLFDSVVGNPPYIRYHKISAEAEKRAIDRLKDFNISISRRASYWAFFLLYSMQFLKRGGRLAMILPGAILHTDYSQQVRKLLTEHFRDVTVVLLEERVFDGTQEESVLVFGDGAREDHQSIRIGTIKKIEELPEVLNNRNLSTSPVDENYTDKGWLFSLVDKEAIELYNALISQNSFIRLGDWVNIRLGVVTGNNNYFILSRNEIDSLGIDRRFFKPIIRRPMQLKGLFLKNEDAISNENQDKSYLLSIRECDYSIKQIKNYIDYGEKSGVNQGTKCRDRKPWYSVPDIFVPSAFVPCMSSSWPRLIVNRSDFTCTNNILRLVWKNTQERQEIDWLRLAVGSFSSISQFSAELVGRSYGGGVLKLEPKELAQLIIPVLDEEKTLNLGPILNSLLVQGKTREVTKIVDEEIIKANVGINQENNAILANARNVLYKRRRQHRNDSKAILQDL